MIYKLYEEDRRIYATRVQIDNLKLCWHSTNGVSVLIVKSPFQVNPESDLEKIIDYMNSSVYDSNSNTGDFIHVIGTDYSVYYMSNIEFIQKQGKKINVDSASYTVYPCLINGSEIQVYKQSSNISRNHIGFKIQLEINVIKKYNQEAKRIGWKKEVEQVFSGFYQIVFSDVCLDLVKNKFFNAGDLYLDVNGFFIPINDDVINRKTIYIKSDIKPIVKTERKDIDLINNNK